jgi:hypothetical protein
MSVSLEQFETLLGRLNQLEAKIAELEQPQADWVKLEWYCEHTGDTKDAVYSRRHKGKWADGIHCEMRDGRLWINYREAQKWKKKNRNTSRPV